MIDQTAEEIDSVRLVIFRLGTKVCAVDIKSIVEIIYYKTVTTVPEVPEFIEGIIDLRGAIIPVIDLRKRFNTGVSEQAEHILIVQIASKKMGLMVDLVEDIFSVSQKDIQEADKILDCPSPAINGVCKIGERLILVLDLTRLWSSSELNEIQNKFESSNKA